eukprot:2445958-Rhodomonas_salina.1
MSEWQKRPGSSHRQRQLIRVSSFPPISLQTSITENVLYSGPDTRLRVLWVLTRSTRVGGVKLGARTAPSSNIRA